MPAVSNITDGEVTKGYDLDTLLLDGLKAIRQMANYDDSYPYSYLLRSDGVCSNLISYVVMRVKRAVGTGKGSTAIGYAITKILIPDVETYHRNLMMQWPGFSGCEIYTVPCGLLEHNLGGTCLHCIAAYENTEDMYDSEDEYCVGRLEMLDFMINTLEEKISLRAASDCGTVAQTTQES